MSIINFSDYELKKTQELDIYTKESIDSNKLSNFNFLCGPPFCSGTYHHGHYLNMTMKDIILKNRTMEKLNVHRRMGYDTMGLPIEMIIQKKYNLSNSDEIIKFGIEKFKDECNKFVDENIGNWNDIIPRMGISLQLDNPYITKSIKFRNVEWNVFKTMWDKNLIYQGYKVMPYSYTCQTVLSLSEAKDNYKDITDLSVIVKFPLKDSELNLLVWTTTPWTLPSNSALCINKNHTFIQIDNYIYAKNSSIKINGKTIKEFSAKELIGKEYIPPFQYNKQDKFIILEDDYVGLDGTGIVHQAPAHGEDDYRVCLNNNIIDKEGNGLFCAIDDNGFFNNLVPDYQGRLFRDCNLDIAINLKDRNLLYKKQNIKHQYPHCWRTDTPLIYIVKKSWFVNIEKIKNDLIKNSESITWTPSRIKTQFMNWIENSRDWAIERSRYWGCTIPLVEKEGIYKCYDSEELRDKLLKEGYKQIDGVLDCWFDSGCALYACNMTAPVDFVCEGSDQFRCWFYYLNIISTIMENKPAFKHGLVNGIMLNHQGEKMSKRLSNFTAIPDLIKKYGTDGVRFYMSLSPVVKGETLCFKDKDVYETIRGNFIQWINAHKYLTEKMIEFPEYINNKDFNELDVWIHNRLQLTTNNIRKYLQDYNIQKAAMELSNFIEIMCNRYLKYNRPTFKRGKSILMLKLIIKNFSILMSPFTPFLSDKIYVTLKDNHEPESTVLYKYDNMFWFDIDNDMEPMNNLIKIIDSINFIRAKNNIIVKQPIKSTIITYHNNYILENIKSLEHILKTICNLIDIKYENSNKYVEKDIIPNMQVLGKKYKKDTLKIIKQIANGEYDYDDTEVIIKNIVKPLNGYTICSEYDFIIYCDINEDKEIKEKLLTMEFASSIQKLRKEAGIKPYNKIKVYYDCDEKTSNIFKKYYELINQKVLYEVINNKYIGNKIIINKNINDVDIWIVNNEKKD